jgi:hypothetical protein
MLRYLKAMRSGWTRAFWTIMFVAHAPAVVVAWRSLLAGDLSAARFAILLASQVLFLLKILDVRFLRLPAAPRARFAIVSMVVLLHAGVIKQAGVQDFDNPQAWVVMTVGAVVSAGAALLLRVRKLDGVRPRQTRGRSRSLLARILEHISETSLPPRYIALARACPIDRAPPH